MKSNLKKKKNDVIKLNKFTRNNKAVRSSESETEFQIMKDPKHQRKPLIPYLRKDCYHCIRKRDIFLLISSQNSKEIYR
jgi:hypothetical protein